MLIDLKDICKAYGKKDSKIFALKHINFSVQQGEFIAIMGPSGSGKSTLMSILGCLDAQFEGEYFFHEKSIRSFSQDQLAELRNAHIGFVFQAFHLLPKLTAYENVELPLIYAGISPEKRRPIICQALKEMGLTHRLHHLPTELSGGQKQRVAIARAIVNRPDLLLADEPTGNLDSKTSMEIMELLHALNQEGRTIVFITHEKEIAQCANKIFYLCDGELY